uniref:DDE Tnp4 domain-containing protein n=1 Tax=Anopheles maculatus TaxID=74869 RepID=A0A182SWK8_9DIPT
DEWLKVSREFEYRWNFPRAIGAVSGKRVKIQAPKNEHYPGNDLPSIVLLAVCDADYNFMYADAAGWPDRVTGGEIFQSCSMFPMLERKALNIPDAQIMGVPYAKPVPYTFLADEAFAADYTICPFAKDETSSAIQSKFNLRFAAAHSVIENALGILFSRFRVLLGPIQLELDVVKSIVLATVYLHNFLRKGHSANIYMPPESIDRTVDGNVIRGDWRTDPSVTAAVIGLNVGRHTTISNSEEDTNHVRTLLANVLSNL